MGKSFEEKVKNKALETTQKNNAAESQKQTRQ